MMIDIEKIERIKLEPGDVLHVKSDTHLSSLDVERIHKQMKELFPNNKFFISDISTRLSFCEVITND